MDLYCCQLLRVVSPPHWGGHCFCCSSVSTPGAILPKHAFACLYRSGLGLAAGEPAVVTNGRVTRLEGLEPLLAEDFRLLDQYSNTAQVAKQVSDSLRRVCALLPAV